jgi:hypothetical protein
MASPVNADSSAWRPEPAVGGKRTAFLDDGEIARNKFNQRNVL